MCSGRIYGGDVGNMVQTMTNGKPAGNHADTARHVKADVYSEEDSSLRLPGILIPFQEVVRTDIAPYRRKVNDVFPPEEYVNCTGQAPPTRPENV